MVTSLVVLALALVILPPLVASLEICVPKWWEQHAPAALRSTGQRWAAAVHMPRTGVGGPAMRVLAHIGNALYFATRVVFTVMASLILLPIVLVFVWLVGCGALVERACPYTDSTERRTRFAKEWRDICKLPEDAMRFVRYGA